jgi:hypothetical protein
VKKISEGRMRITCAAVPTVCIAYLTGAGQVSEPGDGQHIVAPSASAIASALGCGVQDTKVVLTGAEWCSAADALISPPRPHTGRVCTVGGQVVRRSPTGVIGWRKMRQGKPARARARLAKTQAIASHMGVRRRARARPEAGIKRRHSGLRDQGDCIGHRQRRHHN